MKCSCFDSTFLYFYQINVFEFHIIAAGDKPVFQCELCPTTCGRKTDLRIHVQKLHTSDKPLKCKRCGKSFPDRYTYKVRSQKCFLSLSFAAYPISHAVVRLTLTLVMWRIWWAPTNAGKWQMGFNSAFKGLSLCLYYEMGCTVLWLQSSGLWLFCIMVDRSVFEGTHCIHLQGRSASHLVQRSDALG